MTFPEPGALIKTLFAPASKCQLAFSSEVKSPVHSKTISTPNFFQGKFLGSLSDKTSKRLPLITISLVSESLVISSNIKLPCAESYFSRYANCSASVKSLIPTISKFGLLYINLNANRPIRPKPLIATLIAILYFPP